MYGKSMAMGAVALAVAGAARAHGLDLDLDLNLGGGAKDCAENKCYGNLVRANVKLDVGGLCVNLLAAVNADLSALPGDLAACASLDVLTSACRCIAHGGAGSGNGDSDAGNGNGGSGSGGASTLTQAFPVVTMTASMTGGDGVASQTNANGMASMTASATASHSSAAAVTPPASHAEHLTVSTVTTTRWKSVIDCPASVTDCPAVTSQVDVYTTTCPVSGPQVTAPAGGDMPGGGSMPIYTVVKTLYSTNWHTVTKCSSTVSQCVSERTLLILSLGPVSALCARLGSPLKW